VSKKRRDRAFLRKAKRLQAEGQGVFKIEFVHHCDVPGLFLASASASASGDGGATRTAGLIGQFLRKIVAARPTTLCLLCDNEFSRAALPWTIAIMTAQRDDPTAAILNGICIGCAGKNELEAAVLAKYRDSLIPDLRLLPTFSSPGRA
jgi:hypothetical protein